MIYFSGGNLMSETLMVVGLLAAMFGVLVWCFTRAERVSENAYPDWWPYDGSEDRQAFEHAIAGRGSRLTYHDIWQWDEQQVRQAVAEGRIDYATAVKRLRDIPGTEEQAEWAIQFGWDQGGR